MKRICAAMLLTASGSAFAADFSVDRAPVAAPATAYNWTGLYVGGHLGYAAAHSNWSQ